MRAVEAARERAQRLRGLAHRWRVPRALMDLLATQPDNDRLDTRQFEEHPLRPVALHIIHGEDSRDRYDASSKFNTSREFLHELFELGRKKAREWLDRRLPLISRTVPRVWRCTRSSPWAACRGADSRPDRPRQRAEVALQETAASLARPATPACA
jgi:hypothetical protein